MKKKHGWDSTSTEEDGEEVEVMNVELEEKGGAKPFTLHGLINGL